MLCRYLPRSAALAFVLLLGLSASPAQGQPVLFVVNGGNNTVGEYDATTGATINATFISGQGLNDPFAAVLGGDNHLLISNSNNNTVGEYDAITGATINATFVNGQGLNGPARNGAGRPEPPVRR